MCVAAAPSAIVPQALTVSSTSRVVTVSGTYMVDVSSDVSGYVIAASCSSPVSAVASTSIVSAFVDGCKTTLTVTTNGAAGGRYKLLRWSLAMCGACPRVLMMSMQMCAVVGKHARAVLGGRIWHQSR